MISKKEKLINGKLYEVVPVQNYIANPDAYLQGYTAVEDSMGHVYPVVSSSSQGPGVKFRSNSPILFAKVPDKDIDQYTTEGIIDYSKATDIREFIKTQDMVKELEKEILTSPDNIYVPLVDTDDSPAMKALKTAVSQKQIDLNKYEPRFGSNFNNDKRVFNKQTISLPMLVRMCNALDIKATLTLEDQIGEIANPINDKISIEITSVSGDNEESE